MALRSAQRVIREADLHLAMLKARGRKGKVTINDLRHHHVYMTALLCEFIDRSFVPARTVTGRDYGNLLTAARLLAKPIFGPDLNWERTVRAHVDRRNAGQKIMAKKMRARHDSRP